MARRVRMKEFSDFLAQSPMAWMERHATILGIQREEIKYPDLRANWIQIREEEIIKWMEAHGLPANLIKLKGRRQGSSTGSLGNMAHRLRARPTSALICGLDYTKNTKVMANILWRMIESDTYPWGVTHKKTNNAGEFSNKSKLELQSANTPNAGRGDAVNFLLCTEVAYYPDTEAKSDADLFQNLMQMVPREAGSVVILESTPNGEGGKFHSTWVGAITFEALQKGMALKASGAPFEEVERYIPPNWNGFVKIFYPWHEFPDYQDEVTPQEAVRILANLTDRETELVAEFPHIDAGRLKWRRRVIAGIDFEGDEDKFETEYPSDEIRCFAASGRPAYAWQILKQMRDGCKKGEHGKLTPAAFNNFTFEPCDEKESWVRIFERPIHGCMYLQVTDPMTGEQASGNDPDNHAPGILRMGYYDKQMKWIQPALVARLADCHAEMQARKQWSIQCRWGIELLEEYVYRLCRYYGNCMSLTEENKDTGIIILQKARGTMNMYRREETDKITNKITEYYGFRTTPKNRGVITENLGACIRARGKDAHGLDIWDERVIVELQKAIIDEDGKITAGSGWHDDALMMLSMGMMALGKATMYYNPAAMREQFREGRGRGMAPVDSTWA